uniref:Ribosome assembly factor mrt4 n=1 Tax=Bartheletia paradoxa TaxID=669517 RepID=A0A2D0XHT9_9BASI|nr:hypothetical protein SPAR01817 [Bartheletia paradoxa]
MPKSRRNKTISLTQTDKKGREHKTSLIEEIKTNADKYDSLWLFEVGDMRNSHLKDVRSAWTNTGRMFFGRNRVMALALGTTPEDEHLTGISGIANRLEGNVGLFFTSEPREKVEAWFADFSRADYARAGNRASKDIDLPEGTLTTLSSPPTPFAHSLEPHLRSLGLSTTLIRGVPSLTAPHRVCSKGSKLTAEQARLLKLLECKMANFRVRLGAVWDKKTEGTEVIEREEGDEEFNTGMDDEMDEEEDDGLAMLPAHLA